MFLYPICVIVIRFLFYLVRKLGNIGKKEHWRGLRGWKVRELSGKLAFFR
ncbi:hypothetical protein METHB2_160048 [Candidatus Methylobacter favarea]|uniref:Uncharacterized protein n=1 Tax=Candidatus Methylobacter favarea TaxID=2707345 RepID=A0A8S0WHQ0_9GAMM|nr:hypothetical protein METHB2_160048 [Candidatus Methylobacter favarea]